MRLVGAGLLLAAAVGAAPAAAQTAPLDLRAGETLLEVDAAAAHPSRPDVMRFEAGVVSTGRTARDASEANAALVQRMIESLRGSGIAARDVRTTQLRISPRFERSGRDGAEEEAEPRILGYVAQNRVEIRVRDLSRASAILDSLIAAGANEVSGPIFELADERPARRAARELAVAAAREEAETYAAALGLRVVRVLRLSERSALIHDDSYIVVTGSRVSGTPVEPGEVRTEVRVYVDYALAPR